MHCLEEFILWKTIFSFGTSDVFVEAMFSKISYWFYDMIKLGIDDYKNLELGETEILSTFFISTKI